MSEATWWERVVLWWTVVWPGAFLQLCRRHGCMVIYSGRAGRRWQLELKSWTSGARTSFIGSGLLDSRRKAVEWLKGGACTRRRS